MQPCTVCLILLAGLGQSLLLLGDKILTVQDTVNFLFQKRTLFHDGCIAAAVFALYFVNQKYALLDIMKMRLIEFHLLQVCADTGALFIQCIIQIQ